MQIILGCDTSCDDTTVGIIRGLDHTEILSNVKFSQDIFSIKYGGVVPEVSARSHLEEIKPTFLKALNVADIKLSDIDFFACTVGPGLIGGLLVGSTFIKTLAKLENKPFIGIHHLEGHIASCRQKPPFLALIISGGHSLISLYDESLSFTTVCNTLDDSAGEVFDKIGRIMGLPFPAGAHIEDLATQAQIFFPIPKITHGRLAFSFSGLKTKCKQMLEKGINAADVAFFLQESITSHLVDKLRMAVELTGIQKISVCGGVSANKYIRKELSSNFNCFFPSLELCTDNGAMIALAAKDKILLKQDLKKYFEEFSSKCLS